MARIEGCFHNIAARFWSRVECGYLDGCWPWTGPVNHWGYGVTQFLGRCHNASRVAAILALGPFDASLVVCHRCDNPVCCRPSHLFVATQAENLRDCRDKGRAVYLSGVDHHRACAKLTAEQILDARTAYFVNGETQTAIARRLGVHSSTVSRAVRGQRWEVAEQLAAGGLHEPA